MWHNFQNLVGIKHEDNLYEMSLKLPNTGKNIYSKCFINKLTLQHLHQRSGTHKKG